MSGALTEKMRGPRLELAILDELPAGFFDTNYREKPKPTRHQVQCPCGRFAKWAGDRHYYNGMWDMYEFYTDCSRCGRQVTQCV